jgi:hypothetical protein
MIGDARRLCVRNRILFRKSTRRHIISSKNTRYGVDDADIKNTMSLSSSYFNSLSQPASPAEQEKMQQEIRPRFLQMLVLLLALLNDGTSTMSEDARHC